MAYIYTCVYIYIYIYIYIFSTLRESPPPSCVLAVGFGIPCLHSVPESYTIAFRGSLGGGLGAMLGSKIGLGRPLGGVWGPSWPQEPIKTPKGETTGIQGQTWHPQLGGHVGPRWGQVGARWAINWLSCQLVHSSLYPSAQHDPAEPI